MGQQCCHHPKQWGKLLTSVLLVSVIVLASSCLETPREEGKRDKEPSEEQAPSEEGQVAAKTVVARGEEEPVKRDEVESQEKREYVEKRLEKAHQEVFQLLRVEDAEIFRDFVALREKAVKSLEEAEEAYKRGDYEKSIYHAAWTSQYSLQARQKLRGFREIDPILVEMIRRSYDDLEAQRNRFDSLLMNIEENGPIIKYSIRKEGKRGEKVKYPISMCGDMRMVSVSGCTSLKGVLPSSYTTTTGIAEQPEPRNKPNQIQQTHS